MTKEELTLKLNGRQYKDELSDELNIVIANTDDKVYMWTFTTKIPYTTFDIMEGKEYFCRGIVFSVNDLK